MARNLPKMMAIEYNTWLSLISHIKTSVQQYTSEYGLGGLVFHIIPAFAPSSPGGLTISKKPAIILQKIYLNPDKIGMGNMLGTFNYIADGEDIEFDVKGVRWASVFQINVLMDNNMQCSLITSLLTERSFPTYERIDIPLNNYLSDVNNPVRIGTINMNRPVTVNNGTGNQMQDYSDAIRLGFETVQYIIIEDEVVDLSKGIKITQQIIT